MGFIFCGMIMQPFVNRENVFKTIQSVENGTERMSQQEKRELCGFKFGCYLGTTQQQYFIA